MEKKHEEEIATCVAIQKIGQATIQEIKEKLLEWKLDLTKKRIRGLCKKLQKKGLISLNYTTESGINETAYSLSKAIFARDIPIAHYKDIVDYPEAKEFLKTMEIKKGTSKGRKPDHCKYKKVEVEWEVLDKVLGYMPFTSDPDLLCHYRDGKNIVFLPAHFRAYIGQNLRLINKSASLKNYIAYNYGTVDMNGKKMELVQHSILDWNQGKGIRKYEVIPKGAIIKTSFRIPTTDFKDGEFKTFLEIIGEQPIRGFGGRSSVYGRLKVKSFKEVG